MFENNLRDNTELKSYELPPSISNSLNKQKSECKQAVDINIRSFNSLERMKSSNAIKNNLFNTINSEANKSNSQGSRFYTPNSDQANSTFKADMHNNIDKNQSLQHFSYDKETLTKNESKQSDKKIQSDCKMVEKMSNNRENDDSKTFISSCNENICNNKDINVNICEVESIKPNAEVSYITEFAFHSDLKSYPSNSTNQVPENTSDKNNTKHKSNCNTNNKISSELSQSQHKTDNKYNVSENSISNTKSNSDDKNEFENNNLKSNYPTNNTKSYKFHNSN